MILVLNLKSLQNPNSSHVLDFLVEFFFIVLCVTFRYMIHFELIFWKVLLGLWLSCLLLAFKKFAYGCPIVPASFVGKDTLSSLNYLCSFANDQLAICVGLFLGSILCFIDMSSILSLIPCSLDYCWFMFSLEIR